MEAAEAVEEAVGVAEAAVLSALQQMQIKEIELERVRLMILGNKFLQLIKFAGRLIL